MAAARQRPAPNQPPLVPAGPSLPVGKAAEQEEAWNILRRYRRQVKPLPLPYRRFVVESLYADLIDELAQPAPAIGEMNGAPVVADAARDAPL